MQQRWPAPPCWEAEQYIPFELKDAVSEDVLAGLSDAERLARIRPAEGLAFAYPAVHVDALSAAKFCQGQSILTTAPAPGEYRIYDDLDRFLGTGESNDQRVLHPKRVLLPAGSAGNPN